MSILNLGLQCVGLARAEMSEEFEMEVEKSKTLSDLRNSLNSKKDLVKKSLSPVKDTLNSTFTHLCFRIRILKFTILQLKMKLAPFGLTLLHLMKL